MHNDIYRLTHNITKEVICVGTQKEVVNYMIEMVQEACEQTKESLAKKIKIALNNGTLLFRKYEIAEDEPVKHIAPNKHSVPGNYLSVVQLKNSEMLTQLQVLKNIKKRFPNDTIAIQAQEQFIKNHLMRVNCGEFVIQWNEKGNRYDKAPV
jgi:hypothetical protein